MDVSLLGCGVTYKEKQLKRKEHKLKIVPVGGEAIVLGLQSKEQTEQWLKVTLGLRLTLISVVPLHKQTINMPLIENAAFWGKPHRSLS